MVLILSMDCFCWEDRLTGHRCGFPSRLQASVAQISSAWSMAQPRQSELCKPWGSSMSMDWFQGKSTAGWWFEPLWKILVNWDNYSQQWENKKCSKPPIRLVKQVIMWESLVSREDHSIPLNTARGCLPCLCDRMWDSVAVRSSKTLLTLWGHGCKVHEWINCCNQPSGWNCKFSTVQQAQSASLLTWLYVARHEFEGSASKHSHWHTSLLGVFRHDCI